MAESTRISSPEAERFNLYERDVNGGSSDFDNDFSSAENKNTKRKTETDMRIFSSFLLTMNEMRLAETIEPVELDKYLATFFTVIKKHDGNDYEPASLRGMLCSIERYLRARNYPKSLTRDSLFINTRNTLKDRQHVLREVTKNAKKGKQEVLTVTSVEKLKQLYTAKEFGPYSPMAVINSLCFAFVVHLKIRKAIDHKQLLWGDIVLKCHGSTEYLCYQPVPDRDYIRPKLSNISHYRIYAQSESGSPADPVSVYKLYASKRPSQTMAPDFPFYLGLAVNCQTTEHPPLWFKASPMGVNKLNDLVRMIREITGRMASSVSDDFHSDADIKGVRCMTTRTPDSTCSSNCSVPVPDKDYSDDDVSATNDSRTLPADNNGIYDSYTTEDNVGQEHSDHIDPKGKYIAASSTEQSDEDISEQCENTSCSGSNADKEDDKQQTKEAISNILSRLCDSDRTEIVKWFRESYIDIGTKPVCNNCETPKRFSINFTWRPTDVDVVAAIQTTSLEALSPTENSRTLVSVPYESNTTTDPARDRDDKRQRCKTVTNANFEFNRASDVKNRPVCVTNALILPYKRSKSEEYDREQKLRRVRQISDDVTQSNESASRENEKEVHENGVVGIELPTNDSNDPTPALTHDMPVTSFPGNTNPWFAPWAFDPRLAMYLRHGLVPMYGTCAPDMGNVHATDA